MIGILKKRDWPRVGLIMYGFVSIFGVVKMLVEAMNVYKYVGAKQKTGKEHVFSETV